jgi:hypothetical protein
MKCEEVQNENEEFSQKWCDDMGRELNWDMAERLCI